MIAHTCTANVRLHAFAEITLRHPIFARVKIKLAHAQCSHKVHLMTLGASISSNSSDSSVRWLSQSATCVRGCVWSLCDGVAECVAMVAQEDSGPSSE